MQDAPYQNYHEWRHALTELGGIPLTSEFARERIEALQNPGDPYTVEFQKQYGDTYLQQVIRWFEQAEKGY